MKTIKNLGLSFRIKNRIFPRSNNLSERLASRYSKDEKTGCWVWFGTRNRKGYGCLSYQRKYYAAHRLSYELEKGKIPQGLQIDHLCKNKSCVNPTHLEAVTLFENIRRSVRTHCKRGHDLSESNVYNGKRHCRQCNKARSTEWRKRHC